MQKFFGFALCAGLASFLAVIYTLLSIDWEERPGVNLQAPAAAAPAQSPPAPAAGNK